MFKQIFLPLILVALFITIVGLLTQGKLNKYLPTPSSLPEAQKTITINNVDIKVTVAKTDIERSKGLSNITYLDPLSGMIFVFNKNSKPTFWMKDTKIPLDFIWIDDNKVVEINKNVPTETNKSESELTRYPSSYPVDYVLEVNAGFTDKYDIKVGQSLSGLEQL